MQKFFYKNRFVSQKSCSLPVARICCLRYTPDKAPHAFLSPPKRLLIRLNFLGLALSFLPAFAAQIG
jgi:hypothetical protein